MAKHLLILDTDPDQGRNMKIALGQLGYGVVLVDSRDGLFAELASGDSPHPDLMILDTSHGGVEVVGLVGSLIAAYPEIPVLVTDSCATVRKGVVALKQGARDYLVKPVTTAELQQAVEAAMVSALVRQEMVQHRPGPRNKGKALEMIGSSAKLRRVLELARKVAPTNANVLILGESGVGKELVASTIHYASKRSEQRFLTINCAALTDTLLESQLFGHMKGAFTGAVANQRGLIEEADRGTLFLDEIGDISPALQAKLLRVLQEGEYIPIGATRQKYADVRFLAATNKDLEEEVASGRFREDLYYRLNVISLPVPPLRERPEDIRDLVENFLGRFRPEGPGISDEALSLLQGYPWPGNVRELENVVEMAAIIADDQSIGREHLPSRVTEGGGIKFSLPESQMSMADVERQYILQVFEQTRNHKSRTAEILDISRKTLDRKLAAYGVTGEE